MDKIIKKSKRLFKHKKARLIAALVLAVIIFYLGIFVGDGQLSFNKLSSENGALPNTLDYSSVNQVYSLIKNNYDGKLTTSQILDGIKSGIAQSTGNEWTEYFNATQAKQLNSELSDSFDGIGAQLEKDSKGNLVIVAPIAGSPASKAGLQPQDIITTINGKTTTNLPIDQAVNDIRGPAGTQVTLKVVRNSTQQLSFTITRQDITVPSVNSSILAGNIGYLQITQFTNDTATLAAQAAQSFKTANVKGIILDLRDNPGGYLNAAVSVSSLWVPSGKTVLQEKRGNQVIQTYTASGNNILGGIPTAVLINSGSASASEITAGALHDNGLARVIGTKSFGKGSVQQIFNLDDGGELKITIARWYRPDGQNIDGIGITPDQTVNNPTASTTDAQKDAAITWINQQ